MSRGLSTYSSQLPRFNAAWLKLAVLFVMVATCTTSKISELGVQTHDWIMEGVSQKR